MNKQELIKDVAKRSGQTNQLSAKMVAVLVNSIQEQLSSGGEVMIVGFGKFTVYERRARTGRNPLNNEPIEIVARRCVRFKAGKNLSEAV